REHALFFDHLQVVAARGEEAHVAKTDAHEQAPPHPDSTGSSHPLRATSCSTCRPGETVCRSRKSASLILQPPHLAWQKSGIVLRRPQMRHIGSSSTLPNFAWLKSQDITSPYGER